MLLPILYDPEWSRCTAGLGAHLGLILGVWGAGALALLTLSPGTLGCLGRISLENESVPLHVALTTKAKTSRSRACHLHRPDWD